MIKHVTMTKQFSSRTCRTGNASTKNDEALFHPTCQEDLENPKNGPKVRFLWLSKNLIHSSIFFLPECQSTNSLLNLYMPGKKIDSLVMVGMQTNQNAVSFTLPYLRNELRYEPGVLYVIYIHGSKKFM